MRLLAKSNTARRKRPSLKSGDWLVGIRSWGPAGRGMVCQQRPGRWAAASTNPKIAAAAIIAAAIVAALGMAALSKVQEPVEEAFATSGVRLQTSWRYEMHDL